MAEEENLRLTGESGEKINLSRYNIERLEENITNELEEWEDMEESDCDFIADYIYQRNSSSSPEDLECTTFTAKKQKIEKGHTEANDSPIYVSENEDQSESQRPNHSSPRKYEIISSESEKETPTKISEGSSLVSSIISISDTDEDEELPTISWNKINRNSRSVTKPLEYDETELKDSPQNSYESDECHSTEGEKTYNNRFRSLTVHNVEVLPYDIDGECAYSLSYDKTKGNRMKSSTDGRNWHRYNKSYTGDFRKTDGLRLKSRCKGSLQCQNKDCPFLTYYGRPNCKHTVQIKGVIKCSECHSNLCFLECPAIKIWEFRKNYDTVAVFHSGQHTCYPVQKPNPPLQDLKSAFKLNPSLRPVEVANKLLMKKVEECSSREEVEDIAFSLTDSRKIRNVKQQMVNSEPVTTKLKELQEKSVDCYNDPFFVYEYQLKEQKNNKWFISYSKVKGESTERTEFSTTRSENFETFVIKSSKCRLDMMLEVMKKDHFLGEEWVYMDFKMKRVRKKGNDLKTLGLSVYHPLLKRVIWLARMDCETESSKTVTRFCNSLDSMLSEYTKGNNKSFRPSSGWMLDEGGALHSALNERYGKQYCDENVVTCRLHFAQCATRHIRSAFMGDASQSQQTTDFKTLLDELVNAPTVNMYNLYYKRIEQYIQSINRPNLLRWLQWWDSRRTHISEAYRPSPSCPNTNLAEASHASMELSGGTNLNLAESAIFDISESFKLEQSLKAYSMGVTKPGTGPSKATKDKRIQQRVLTSLDALMSELDEQHGGGIAPTQPATSSFRVDQRSSHRADKGPQTEKRPSGRRRNVISTALSSSIQKAKEMADTTFDITVNSPTQGSVQVNYREKSYRVTFDQLTECTCPFSETRDLSIVNRVPCKHRLYILMKIGFKETDDILRQFSYTQNEIRSIIHHLSQYQQDEVQTQQTAGNCKTLKLSRAHVTDNETYEVTFLHGVIKKCYGCEKEFSPGDRKAPYDLVLRHLEVRPRYDPARKKWYLPPQNETSNAYYHLNKSCVKNIHKSFERSTIIIPIQLQSNLSEEHKQVIRLSGLVDLD